jgi:hypothetical protein
MFQALPDAAVKCRVLRLCTSVAAASACSAGDPTPPHPSNLPQPPTHLTLQQSAECCAYVRQLLLPVPAGPVAPHAAPSAAVPSPGHGHVGACVFCVCVCFGGGVLALHPCTTPFQSPRKPLLERPYNVS